MIVESLPAAMGQRNRQVFELARALKAIPALADAPADSLQPYVRRWHTMGVAKQVIKTEPFEETLDRLSQGLTEGQISERNRTDGCDFGTSEAIASTSGCRGL